MKKGARKVCSRGHVFYKNSLCPVCPTCWPGRAKKMQSDFPKIGAPALRALHNVNIKSLRELTEWTKADLIMLHGIGPKALQRLYIALRKKRLSFARN